MICKCFKCYETNLGHALAATFRNILCVCARVGSYVNGGALQLNPSISPMAVSYGAIMRVQRNARNRDA